MAGTTRFILFTFILAAGITLEAAAAPVPLQIDNFENGTTQGWGEGLPAVDPVNVTTGGPAGADDNFLRVSATGTGGPGSRLIVLSRAPRWQGNFSAIPAIEMDLRHLGAPPLSTSPLSMRIALMSGTTSYAVTTTPYVLTADAQWHHVSFPLNASALTASGTSLASILSSVTELRIMHSTGADHRGDAINTAFGVDNVFAVPEPSIILLTSASGLLLMRRRA